jgi:small GTP-binding protein
MRQDNSQIEKAEELLFKVLVWGEAGVGKTALINRWKDERDFSTHYRATLGVDFVIKALQKESQTVRLQVWDIAGIERFGKMMGKYARDTDVICLMWDSARVHTYGALRKWLESLPASLLKVAPVIFVRGKSDLSESLSEACSQEEEEGILQLAREFGLKKIAIVNTSAKDNEGFDQLGEAFFHAMNLNEDEDEEATQNNRLKLFDDLSFPANSLPYQATQFKHTRKVRFGKLNEIMENKSEVNFTPIEPMWLLMNLISINDLKSQTSLWIEKRLVTLPSKTTSDSDYEIFWKARLDYTRKNNPQETKFYTELLIDHTPLGQGEESRLAADLICAKPKEVKSVTALLALLSKKETQIFGFKIFCLQAGRAKQYKEMALIYDVARQIFDFILPAQVTQASNSNADLRIENNNNAPADEDGKLTRTQLLSGLAEKHQLTEIPAEVKKIVDELLGLSESAPQNSPNPSN